MIDFACSDYPCDLCLILILYFFHCFYINQCSCKEESSHIIFVCKQSSILGYSYLKLRMFILRAIIQKVVTVFIFNSSSYSSSHWECLLAYFCVLITHLCFLQVFTSCGHYKLFQVHRYFSCHKLGIHLFFKGPRFLLLENIRNHNRKSGERIMMRVLVLLMANPSLIPSNVYGFRTTIRNKHC